jgi:UDP-N-acetylmuramoylalanine--D-glutamate ligase
VNTAPESSTQSIQSQPTALVLGLGLTGYSIVRHLAAQDYRLTVADSRELPPYLGQVKTEFPRVEVVTGSIPSDRFDEFDEVIISPGIGKEISNLPDNIVPIGDIELFSRHVKAPVIAITGSNGKSTVTMLATEMLLAAGMKVSAGGNLGMPALDLLEAEVPDIYVLELSSFQLETTHTLAPVSAVVLNISEDHMDRYGDLAEYISAKLRIYSNAKNIVVNRDETHLRSLLSASENSLSFGLDGPPGACDFGVAGSGKNRSLVAGTQVLAQASDMTLQGDQNIANVLAAMALVKSAGVELGAAAIGAAMGYGGLPHRCEIVIEHNGIKWINDSKGTNVGATIAAIQGFNQRLVLIAGGKGKGANFQPLADVIAASVHFTILFGEDAGLISSRLPSNADHTMVASLDHAVGLALEISGTGDVVLFSPACASFDMFDNFEHRGNVFKQLVLEKVH